MLKILEFIQRPFLSLKRIVILRLQIIGKITINKINYWLWNIAEYMHWHKLPPKKLWKKLLHYYDKKAGYIK